MKARIPQGAGGAGNMNQMMQRMQKMQEEMTRAQAELEEKVYHVSAGGGNIEVEINGKKEVTSVTLKPEVVDPDDIEFLQDLIDIHRSASFLPHQAVFRVITFTASGKIIEKPAVEETAARSSWQSISRSKSTVTGSPTTISRA